MIKNSLEELFNSIENSSLYQEYKKMSNILSQDKHIKEIIEEIKELEENYKPMSLKNIDKNSQQNISKLN